MEYHTFEPGEPLNTFVKCYWTLDGPAEKDPRPQTVVPDGCMEMIFHHGGLYRQFTTPDVSLIQPRCFVIGQLTKPLHIAPTGATGIFAVRFHPGGFLPFSAYPAKQLENRAVPLHELFGEEGDTFAGQVLAAPATPERIACVHTFLGAKLALPDNIDAVVRSTVEMILTANGQLPIDEIAGQLHINRRSLERKFSTAIGLSPKQLSKTARLQHVLGKMLGKQYSSLTELAYEGDYYDQAHFIRDFKEFTGLTPKEFYGRHLQLSALFYGMG